MKRCPQCLFIYPESDERCDFDKTPLVAVADSEIDAAIKPRPKGNRGLVLIVGAVVAIGFVVVIFVFYSFSKSTRTEQQTSDNIPVAAAAPVVPEPPPPSPSPSPSPSPPEPKSSPRVATSHTSTSLNPVSTSGPETGTKRVILLTSGGKIDADEVWRTREGVWYRRNGVVTLVKSNRVKAIVSR